MALEEKFFILKLGVSKRASHAKSVVSFKGDSSSYKTVSVQATKGCWWMPWHHKAKKDVLTCEKLRGAGKKRRTGDVRMGKPGGNKSPSFLPEYIG